MNANDPEDQTRQFLSSIHRDNAAAPIVGSDAMGAFLGSSLDALLGEALPLVVDANIFRNDIGYVCRTGRRTTLVTATNARIFRLYCAQHVYDEVEEHAAEWATDMGLDTDAYLSAWRENYVPLVRRVYTDGMDSLLSPAERRRVDRLRLMLDVDDVPSAVLALATGAFFVSEDGAPHEAVYGRTLSAAERRAWLPILHAGGDSAELTRLVAFTAAVPAFAVIGSAYVARRLWTFSPPLLLGLVALAAVLATRVPYDRYRASGEAILTAISVLSAHVYQPHYEALERFRSALPPFPPWEDLVADLSRDAALARACLYRLARSRRVSTESRGTRRRTACPRHRPGASARWEGSSPVRMLLRAVSWHLATGLAHVQCSVRMADKRGTTDGLRPYRHTRTPWRIRDATVTIDLASPSRGSSPLSYATCRPTEPTDPSCNEAGHGRCDVHLF